MSEENFTEAVNAGFEFVNGDNTVDTECHGFEPSTKPTGGYLGSRPLQAVGAPGQGLTEDELMSRHDNTNHRSRSTVTQFVYGADKAPMTLVYKVIDYNGRSPADAEPEGQPNNAVGAHIAGETSSSLADDAEEREGGVRLYTLLGAARALPPRKHLVPEAEILNARRVICRLSQNVKVKCTEKNTHGGFTFWKISGRCPPIVNFSDCMADEHNLFPGMFSVCPIKKGDDESPYQADSTARVMITGLPPEMEPMKVTSLVQTLCGHKPRYVQNRDGHRVISISAVGARTISLLNEKFFVLHNMIYLPVTNGESTFSNTAYALAHMGFDCPPSVRVRVHQEDVPIVKAIDCPARILIHNRIKSSEAPECTRGDWADAETSEANVAMALAIMKCSGTLDIHTSDIISFAMKAYVNHVCGKDVRKTIQVMDLYRMAMQVDQDKP